jgi:MFS family permease
VPLLLVLYFLAGTGVGPIEPAVFRSVARRTVASDRGPVLASVTAIAYVGYLISPPLLGFVPGAFGWTALWAVAAGAGVTVIGLTFLVPRR